MTCIHNKGVHIYFDFFLTEAGDKPIPVPEIQKSTISSMADAVRNKLKHKSDAGVSKKGPMKATIPFGNIQKRG